MTSSDKAFDIRQAKRLFGLIFGEGDWVSIRCIETWNSGGRRHSRVDHGNVATLRLCDLWSYLPAAMKSASDNRCCVYFGVCPRFGGNGQYEEKWAIRVVHTLWCDCDDLRPGGVAERCTASGVPLPTAVVDSGRGVHLYWVLDEPFLISDAGDPPAVHTEWTKTADGKSRKRSYILSDDERNERLYLDVPQNRPQISPRAQHIEDILSGIAAAIGGDHTQDLSRLLRVPGTWRRKDERHGATPILCTVAELHKRRLYDVADFERFAEQSPSRQRRQKIDGVKLPKVRKTLTAAAQDKLNSQVLACDLENNDRSAADFALCVFAIRRGVDREHLWSEVANISKFQDRGRDYFDMTFEAATAAVRELIYDRVMETVRQRPTAGVCGDNDAANVADADGRVANLNAHFKRLGVPRVLADIIQATEHFATAEGGRLFHYTGGCYHSRGESFVKRRVLKILEVNDATSHWSDHVANEVVKYIVSRSPELWECPPMDRVNLKNGILRVVDQTLLSHTPDWLSDIQLPVAFDPAATCPATDKFDAEVFPADCLDLAHELVA